MPRLLAASAMLLFVGATLVLSELRWFSRQPLVDRLRPYGPSSGGERSAGGGLLSRFRRLPGLQTITNDGFAFAPSFADDLISAVEARALWSRFGL